MFLTGVIIGTFVGASACLAAAALAALDRVALRDQPTLVPLRVAPLTRASLN
jgi:hypothetical protein